MQCVRTALGAKRLSRGLWLRDCVVMRYMSSIDGGSPLPDLEQALEKLAKASVPTQSDHDVRARIINDIQESLRRMQTGSGLRVVPFGSFVSSFYDARSDLDLALCGTVPAQDGAKAGEKDTAPATTPVSMLGRNKGAALMRAACEQLVADGLVAPRGVEFILHARVPLVKFTERSSGIEVDLCLGPEATAFKAWSVAQVASINPAFGKLFRVVKVWAKAHAINDGAAHMFNSWCLSLVVMFFLQRHCQPPLLPPLHTLLCDKPPRYGAPRLMQMGASPQPEHLQAVREAMAKRVAAARERYGSLPAPPLDQLFADFVDSSGGMLRALLEGKKPLKNGDHGISVFYGNYRPRAHQRQQLFVEDPYDSVDNTARTLPQWLKGKTTTLHYVTSVFSRTARRLGRQRHHLPTEHQQRPEQQPEQQSLPVADEATDLTTQAQPLKCYLTATGPRVKEDTAESKAAHNASLDVERTKLAVTVPFGGDAAHSKMQLPTDDHVISDGSASVAWSPGGAMEAGESGGGSPPSSSPSCPPLASNLVFLFGPELLTRLPALSGRLLGPALEQWARGALAAGRPAGEVHLGMLQRLGAAEDFEHFHIFKRRHNIRVMNESKWATPEDKEKERPAKRGATKRQKKAATKAAEAQAAAAAGTERESSVRESTIAGATEEGHVSRLLMEQIEDVTAAVHHCVPTGPKDAAERRRVVPKKKKQATTEAAESPEPEISPSKPPRSRSRPPTHRSTPTTSTPSVSSRASTPVSTDSPPSLPPSTPTLPHGSTTTAPPSPSRPTPRHATPAGHKPGRSSHSKKNAGSSGSSSTDSGATTTHSGSRSKAGSNPATHSNRRPDSADSSSSVSNRSNTNTVSTSSTSTRTTATGSDVGTSTAECASNNPSASADADSGSGSQPVDSTKGPRTGSHTRMATPARSRLASRPGPPRGKRRGGSPVAPKNDGRARGDVG